ncbi:hypothetical protein LCGC14_1154210 [marine sediment metagenome]|uniref:Uncharacterized protein n=1 Tax=marine sediment metagenome TaxID=412755 RepID=A0A0F9PCT5_9ZZZZ
MKIDDEKVLIFNATLYSVSKSSMILPYFGITGAKLDDQLMLDMPDIPYRIQNTPKSQRYTFERALKTKAVSSENINKKYMKKLLKDYFIDNKPKLKSEGPTRSLYLDENLLPVIFLTSTEALFVGGENHVKNAHDMSFEVLKAILSSEIDREEICMLDGNSHLYFLGDTAIKKNIFPYFYDDLEELNPGILVGCDSPNSILFNDRGTKLFAEFWAIGRGIGSIFSETVLPDDEVLALDKDVIKRTNINPENNDGVNSLKFVSFVASSKIEYDKPEKKKVYRDLEFNGYNAHVITAPIVTTEYLSWVTVSWLAFLNNYGQFKLGCDIIFPPNQVVMFEDGGVVFKASHIESMKYRGENHSVKNKAGSLTITFKKDTSTSIYTSVSRFFAFYKDLPIYMGEKS